MSQGSATKKAMPDSPDKVCHKDLRTTKSMPDTKAEAVSIDSSILFNYIWS